MDFVEDFFLLEDDSYKKKNFILGSVKNNTSVRVNYQQYRIINAIYNFTKNSDKKMTDEEIEEAIWERMHIKIHLHELSEQLEHKGLLKNSVKSQEHSEVKMMGIQLLSMSFSKIPRLILKSADFLVICKWLEYIIMMVGAFLCIFNIENVNKTLQNHLFVYNSSAVKGFGMSILLSLIVIFIHEIAHILEALRQKMNQGEFHIILYAGFIPMYYTRYPEFIKLKAKSKISILSAGLRTNIAMLFLALGLMGMPCPAPVLNICGLVLLVNLNFIIINISPFSMNDGYYILMTRLGLGSIRVKMWQYLISLFKRGENRNIGIRNKVLFTGYTLISLSFIAFNFLLTIEWVKQIAAEIIHLL